MSLSTIVCWSTTLSYPCRTRWRYDGNSSYVLYDNAHEFSIFYAMTRMGARAMEMKKIYATLRALLDVLEILVGQTPSDRLGRQILEEVIAKYTNLLFESLVCWCVLLVIYALLNCYSHWPFQIKKIKRSDAALRGELMPYNIIPLDASSVGNVVGFFPEVSMFSVFVTILSSHTLPDISLFSCLDYLLQPY